MVTKILQVPNYYKFNADYMAGNGTGRAVATSFLYNKYPFTMGAIIYQDNLHSVVNPDHMTSKDESHRIY